MSFAELKSEVSRLSDAELSELAACVNLARKTRDPGWLDRITCINTAMDAGREHSSAELLRVHEDLQREGR